MISFKMHPTMFWICVSVIVAQNIVLGELAIGAVQAVPGSNQPTKQFTTTGSTPATAPVNPASAPIIGAAAAPALLHVPPSRTRRLLGCANSPDYIQCNDRTLCSAIGWSAPRAGMGTECDCIRMCNLAQVRGGRCHQQWNPPTQSYYYSIQYNGAVFCDPRKGGGGPKGGRRKM